jgi:uncharacterized protein YrrD
MMHRVKRLIGMEVKTPEGKCLGDVRDVLIDYPIRRIVGIVVNAGPLRRKPYYVRRKDIVAIDDTYITIKSDHCLETKPFGGFGLDSSASPLGKAVERPGTGDLGHIRDVLVDTKRLSVWGLEISDGLVSDVLNGVTKVPRREVKRLVGRFLWASHPDASFASNDSAEPHE